MSYEHSHKLFDELTSITQYASALASFAIAEGVDYFIAGSDHFCLRDRMLSLSAILGGELFFYDDRHDVSSDPSIYALMHENRLIYVGQTENTYNRIRDHDKKYKWDEIAAIYVNYDRLLQAECLAIGLLKPTGNFLCDKKYSAFAEKDFSKVLRGPRS